LLQNRTIIFVANTLILLYIVHRARSAPNKPGYALPAEG